jgi:hypothetical protein
LYILDHIMEKGLRLFIKNFFRRETILRAIKVALVVGPILIIINHHDSLLQFEFSHRLYFKFMLTFLVPFCVSAYSSAQAYSAQELRVNESPK